MLKIEDIAKTFNPGTITEKVALKGVSQRRRQIHPDELHRRNLPGGQGKDYH